jgi:hypothetical protein
MSDYFFMINFLKQKRMRRLIYLLMVGIIAGVGFYSSNKTRRTFVFYNVKTGSPHIEERMLTYSPSKEAEIRQYAEEALFGPSDPASAPLFLRGTMLYSLFYDDGFVYINLSETAALPVPLHMDDMPVYKNLLTLQEGLRRNFPFIKRTLFFIEGNEIAAVF